MHDNSYNEILELFLKAVESVKSSGYDAYTEDAKKGLVPVGISNHHVHLTTEAVEVLFGKDYMLERIKNLSQPGQFACKECVTLCGPKGVIEKVRVLGPTRQEIREVCSDIKHTVARCTWFYTGATTEDSCPYSPTDTH